MKKQKQTELSIKEIKELLKKENLFIFNRNISEHHSLTIQKSIKEYGLLRLPIIIQQNYNNKKLAIADGQHTLTAAVNLYKNNDKVNVFIVECETKKEVVKLIAKLNNTSKKWENDDYLNAWLNFDENDENHHIYYFINDKQKTSGISLSKILEIYITDFNDFKNGEVKLHKNLAHRNCIYELAKYFRSTYKTAAHALGGVINFAKTKKWNEKDEVNSFITRVDSYYKKFKSFPKDREDLKDLLEKIDSYSDGEFNSHVQ